MQGRVEYIDDGRLLGWYYVSECEAYGDGTKATAERIERNRREA